MNEQQMKTSIRPKPEYKYVRYSVLAIELILVKVLRRTNRKKVPRRRFIAQKNFAAGEILTAPIMI
jgi:hypothetical protein